MLLRVFYLSGRPEPRSPDVTIVVWFNCLGERQSKGHLFLPLGVEGALAVGAPVGVGAEVIALGLGQVSG